MSSKKIILLILLLMFAIAGQAFAQSAEILPSGEIPKGAYVNGPGGGTDDNYYFITIKIEFDVAGTLAGPYDIILPSDITVADVDGAAGTSNNYDDEVNISWSAGTGADFTLDTTGNTDQTTIEINVAVAPVLNEILYVMIPIEVTESATGTDNITISFNDPALTDIGDLEVTYVDPSDLDALTLTANLDSVDPLETLFYGLFYPGTATAMTAALPDLAVEGTTAMFGSGAGAAQGVLALITNYLLGGDANDVIYTLWYSVDPDLSHINISMDGVTKLKTYDPTVPANHDIEYVSNETGTCATRFIASTLPEGDIYVYITSDLTGDFPLARSDAITIKHEPVVKSVVWDYDNDNLYEPLVANDDKVLTLDTGDFLAYDGQLPAGLVTPRAYVDLYVQVDDYDNNAAVALFRSTVDDLTDTDITFSGLDITGLGSGPTAAVELVDGYFENDEDVDGYIKWRWTLPVDESYVPAEDYYIYAVASDGTSAHLSCSRGDANWTDNLGVTSPLEAALDIQVRNSPYLRFDALSEYDIDLTPDDNVEIDTALDDVIMINWGKAEGVLGDKDIDDSATIELYIDYDDDLPIPPPSMMTIPTL